jgi:ABC-type multidrug transport system fused ATPase/permease subunit
MLSNKSRILSTHQIQYSKYADYIYVLDKGEIFEEGTYNDLLKKEGGMLSQLLQKVQIHEENEDLKKISEISQKKQNNDEQNTLIEVEDKEEGTIQLSVVYEYLKSFGFIWFFLMIALFVFSQLTTESPNWWISQWMTKPENRLVRVPENVFFNVYVSVGYGSVVLLLIRDVIYLNLGMLASKYLHIAALKRLLNAPISFFERNPIGRILSRFSNDVMSVDTEVSVISHEVLTLFVQVLSTMIIIVYSSVWFIIPLIPICTKQLINH